MLRPRLSSVLALAFALVLLPAVVGAQITDRAQLVAALDSASRAYAANDNVAGVSVAVVRGADTLLMKGYGSVDLEWNVPTPADGGASYEIGSMTKQFTSTSILQLVGEGKLDLDADVTTYLPELDTHGQVIPLRRMLDHTSGIKGYTEMPVFGELSVRKLPRDTLVKLVNAEPLEFEPGTALIYNNSAYFMLGLIIERVSGQSYADYVKQHIFDPVGMGHSYYCSESAIRKDRAHGYDARPDGLQRKGYLDHTWPYAAGSLCSTVGDLISWNQALHHGKVLDADAYHLLTTPEPLKDGTPVHYAMGLMVNHNGGRTAITHGGGINGFLSNGVYYPESDLTVIVLQNTAGPRGPGSLSQELANLVLGPPAPAAAGTPYEGDLDELLGTYEGPGRGATLTMVVTRDGDQLVFTLNGQRQGMRPPHREGLTWAEGSIDATFHRVDGGVSRLDIDQGSGHYVLTRTEGPAGS